jgi:antirestriction protein ArdC
MPYAAKREVTQRVDPMRELTDKVTAVIEAAGKVPWRREWDPKKCLGPQATFNAATGEPYHGINAIALGLNPLAFATGDPRHCTYKQAEAKGWRVKKGSKASTVFFFKPLAIMDEKAEDGERLVPILKNYSVFHASQIEGIPPYTPLGMEEASWTRPEAVNSFDARHRSLDAFRGYANHQTPSCSALWRPMINQLCVTSKRRV